METIIFLLYLNYIQIFFSQDIVFKKNIINKQYIYEYIIIYYNI